MASLNIGKNNLENSQKIRKENVLEQKITQNENKLT